MSNICSIVYTPRQSSDNSAINFLCSDKKIHIRFQDFYEETQIVGFERKLTYLLTYLMNFGYLPGVIGQYDDKVLIEGFLKTSDLTRVLDVISGNTCSNNFRGLKLRKNYKKQTCMPFGKVSMDCFPISYESGVAVASNLDEFLNAFKVTLSDYLFNDDYSIVIKEDKAQNVNSKFLNKMTKKKRKQNKKFKLKELW